MNSRIFETEFNYEHLKHCIMKKIIHPYLTLTILFLSLWINALHAGTFTSNVASGNWDIPASWTFVGDADGIPDADDDVTIQASQTIILNTTVSNYCRNLSVSGTVQINLNKLLYINGNYTINPGGAETGINGTVVFMPGTGTTISGTNFSSTTKWTFAASSNRTITAGSVINKNVTIGISSATVTNLGNFSILDVFTHVGAVFTNGSTGALTIKKAGFMNTRTFNASASGNSVTITYNSASIPSATTGGIYHHLIIGGTSITQPSASTVNGNFTVNATRSFNMNGFDMSIGGNMTVNGSFLASNTLTLNGAAAQNVNSASTIALNNLTTNNINSVTIATGTYSLAGTLDILAGNLAISAPVSFTMLSNAGATSRIDELAAGSSITGNMTIERFISARAAGYSDMSSPVSGSTFTDWDNELLMIYTHAPPDYYASNYAYSESLWDYVAITSATTALNTGQGYMVYLDSDGLQTTFNATTVNTLGQPHTGTISMGGYLTRDNDGWNLVGNPYHSFISWSTYQGNSGGTLGGNYMYYDEVIQDFQIAGSGSIAPTQGFWIEVLSLPASADFTESLKDPSTSADFKSTNPIYYTLRLEGENALNYTSNTMIDFNSSFNNAYEQGTDVRFKKVPHHLAPALYSTVAGDYNLRLNRLDPKERVQINLEYQVGADGDYTIQQLNPEMLDVNGYTCVVLKDKQTGTIHNLNQGAYHFYAMVSDDKDRFELHLSRDNNCKLAETTFDLNNINIIKDQTGVFVNFDLTEEENAVVSVKNLLGQQICNPVKARVVNDVVRVDLPSDFTGVFIVTVNVNEKMVTQKFVK